MAMTPSITRTAIVGGSTAGLGLATARALAAAGAQVVITGRRGELARERAAELPAAIGVEADLTTAEGVDEALRTCADRFGDPDILVINGGGPLPGPALTLTADDAERAIALLLLPGIRLVQAAIGSMRERGWGRIVGLGSSGVQQPIPGLAASNVGRAALAGYLKTLAGEVARDGVTVNMVIPGRIQTERVDSLDRAEAERDQISVEDVRRRWATTIPAGRYGTGEEFAALVAFLCGEEASYITGAQLRADGGLIRGL
jgi:3-oxoacyl-[acyl-carrier protein] reductase